MPLRTVKILCFGDSLTSGYTNNGARYHPYAHSMMMTLRLAFPEIKLDISVKGEPGDEVMPPDGDFYHRLKEEWAGAVKRDESYDWVLVLGGTNDLPNSDSDFKAEELFMHLEKLYDLCFSHGAKVIALTIPETSAPIPWLTERRNKVNDMIRNYHKDNFFVFDLNKAMPFLKYSPENQTYWDDGLHFTPKGYSTMGHKVAAFFHPLLKAHIDAMPNEPPSPVSPRTLATTRRRSRVKRDPVDDVDFEEEAGDPSILSQGYIVVRKRDLD